MVKSDILKLCLRFIRRASIMTKMNKDEASENTPEDARIKRRSILKAGAVIAPLALTLHGGIPMAHASSTGCVEDLKLHVDIPNYSDPDGDGIFELTGTTTNFDPDSGVTGRENPDGTSETHWQYLQNEELFGASCLTSIQNSGLTVNF